MHPLSHAFGQNAALIAAPEIYYGRNNELRTMLDEDMEMRKAVPFHLDNWGYNLSVGFMHESIHLMLLMAKAHGHPALKALPYQDQWEPEVYILAIETLAREMDVSQPADSAVNQAAFADPAQAYEKFSAHVTRQAGQMARKINEQRLQNTQKHGVDYTHYTGADPAATKAIFDHIQPILAGLHDKAYKAGPSHSATRHPLELALFKTKVRTLWDWSDLAPLPDQHLHAVPSADPHLA